MQSQLSQLPNPVIQRALGDAKPVEAPDYQIPVGCRVVLLPHQRFFVELIRQHLNGRVVELV